MPGLFAAKKMPATAHVRIDGLIDPGEFSAIFSMEECLHLLLSADGFRNPHQ
jgi:hypothetical protein